MCQWTFKGINKFEDPEASLLNKSSNLAPAFGVTNFTNLVTLCVTVKSDLWLIYTLVWFRIK